MCIPGVYLLSTKRKKEIYTKYHIVIRFLSEKERDTGQTLDIIIYSFLYNKTTNDYLHISSSILLHHRIQYLLMGHRFAFLYPQVSSYTVILYVYIYIPINNRTKDLFLSFIFSNLSCELFQGVRRESLYIYRERKRCMCLSSSKQGDR